MSATVVGAATALHVGADIVIESTAQPVAATLLSLPIRHRSTTFCPDAATGRLTTVVTYPLVVPVQAWRPASGFRKAVDSVPL